MVLMLRVLISYFTFWFLRTKANRIFPNGVVVHGPFEVLCVDKVAAGEGLHLNHGVFINAAGGVTMGSGVILSARVNIISTSLDVAALSGTERSIVHVCSPIEIGDRVWIGAAATVLAGVSIGSGSVVAAGAVVNRSVPENVMVAGVPARVIKFLS